MEYPDYEAAIARLHKPIATATNQSIPLGVLLEGIYEYFDDNDFRLAATILKQAPMDDWHGIETSRICLNLWPSLEHGDCAPSLTAALTHVISEIDASRIYPDEVVAVGEAIEFRLKGEGLVRVRRIQFEEVDEIGLERCCKLLKGIVRQGDDGRLMKRLRSLPGLIYLDVDTGVDSPRLRGQAALLAMTQNFPTTLRRMLQERLGLAVSQSKAADLAANMFGTRDWQTFKGAEARWKGILGPVAIQSDAWGSLLYYRSPAAALWTFQSMLVSRANFHRLRVQYGGAGVSFDALKLKAYDPTGTTPEMETWDSPVLLQTFAPCRVESDAAEDASIVGDLSPIASAADVAAHLSGVLGIGLSREKRIARTYVRQGGEELQLNGYLFTLTKKPGLPASAHLDIQRIGKDGELLPISEGFMCFNAEIEEAENAYRLQSNQGNELIMELEGWAKADVRRLSLFADIPVSEKA